MIACVSIPFFAAAVERRARPALANTPLIITEPPPASEQVLAVSIEAARLGVRSGMSLRQAQSLCNQVQLIPANLAKYQETLDEVWAVLADFTTHVELEAAQPAANSYLELGHLAGKEAVAFVKQLGQQVRRQTNLAPALGLARGKFPAWVAATVTTPNRAIVIAPGHELTFLAPRSINLLPLDVELAQRWQRLGLRTIGQLASLPAGAILVQFGAYGRWLHQLARGQDDRPVQPLRQLPTEQLTRRLDDPVTDGIILTALGQALMRELARRLQASYRLGRVLQLSLELENGVVWTEQVTLRQPANSPERLSQNLETLLNRFQTHCGVVALTLTIADLVGATGRQLDLFTLGGGAEQPERLSEWLPHLIARHGTTCFYQAAVTNPAAYLPESRFQLWSFNGL